MSELKYLYACLKDGTVVSISDADKSQEYYLYPGEQVKLILRQGQVYQKHFAVKSEDLLINGNRVRFNSINESPQHYNFIIDYDVIPFETNEVGSITNIKVLDTDEIANKLMTWFKKKYNSQNRNSSL